MSRNSMVSVANRRARIGRRDGGHAATARTRTKLKGEVYPNFKIEMHTRAGLSR